MIERFSIYRIRNDANMETIHGPIKWSNRLVNQLGSVNNRLLIPKMEGLDRYLLPIIKKLS